MKVLIEQFAGIIGAGIAAACCLGIPVILAAVGAAGVSFLINDAYLFPIFVGFVGISTWVLYRSARKHSNIAPFWVGLAGAALATIGLWLLVTGTLGLPWTIYIGLGVLIAGTVWDAINGRTAVCDTKTAPETSRNTTPVDATRRALTGGAIAIATAGVFYGLHKSVDTLAPKAQAGEIACWGVNSCKGQTACSTAFNACTGMNQCKGKGFINLPEKECYVLGGQPLKGSPADPAAS